MSFRTIVATLLAGCLSISAGAALAADKVLAVVNGTEITESDLQQYIRENEMGAKAEGNRARILNELIGRELVYQDALKKDLAESDQVKQQLEEVRRKLILNAAIERAVSDDPVTEKELKQLYDQQVAGFSQQEFKARHILVESDAKAKEIIGELEDGGDFAALAEEHSTGPSGKQGGDLGWFNPQQMVPEFSQAVAKLEKGQYTRQPVKTQFGWHVIKLEDTRKAEPPPFEKVKDQLQQAVTQQKVSEYISRLRKQGDVEIKQ